MTWGEEPDDSKKRKSPWGDDKNDLNELFKSTHQKFKNVFDNKGSSGGNDMLPFGSGVFIGLFAVLIIVWAATGLYIVQEDEQAVVMRFGKFVRVANPGPNYHLPYPFERTIKHHVTNHQVDEFGYRSSDNNDDRFRSLNRQRPDARNILEESLMLTGDENIVDINFLVRWKIENIKDFTFNIQDPRGTIKMAAESAVREVVGNTKFAEAQTEGRAVVEEKSMKLLQEILHSYGSGVVVLSLQMLKVDPPQQVIDSFRDVQTARADKERLINQAIAYRNDLLPKTRGEADKAIKDAEAYAYEAVARAEGEASRFNSIYTQYKISKNVTKTKMYLEFMEQILADVDKIIIDESAKNIVPYLPLNELKKNNQ